MNGRGTDPITEKLFQKICSAVAVILSEAKDEDFSQRRKGAEIDEDETRPFQALSNAPFAPPRLCEDQTEPGVSFSGNETVVGRLGEEE